jgi:hypothetical protein
MKIPSKIRIGFVDYNVVYFKERSGGLGLGQHNGREALIEIAQDAPPRVQFKAFIHECIHAVIEQYGVSIPKENNEEVVNQLETGIAELVEQVADGSNMTEIAGKELIHQICEVDRTIISMIDKKNLAGIESDRSTPIMRKEDDPNGFVAMVQWTKHLATKLKKQLDNSK